MSKVITINSYHHGVGKSNLATNIAILAAMEGKRVALVDVNFQTPGMHPLLFLSNQEMPVSLKDYLQGTVPITESTYDVTGSLQSSLAGSIFFVPSHTGYSQPIRLLQMSDASDLFAQGVHTLIDELDLDMLLLDTSAGLCDETLLMFALSDMLLVVLRLDQRDYQGTSVTIEVAHRLDVSRVLLLVNQTPLLYDLAEISSHIERTFGCEVGAVLPYVDDIMALAGRGIFVLRYPQHMVTHALRRVMLSLLEA